MWTIAKEFICPRDENGFTRLLPQDDPSRTDDTDYIRLYREKYEICSEQDVKSILEIGVRAGYSAMAFMHAHPKASYVGMDAENGSHGGKGGPWTWWASVLLDKHFPDTDHKIIIADTQKMDKLPWGPYDFIHVDGDHTADGAYHDMKICWPFVAAGGRMVIDDYTFLPEVAKGVDRWLDDFGDLPSAVDFRGTVRGDVVVYK